MQVWHTCSDHICLGCLRNPPVVDTSDTPAELAHHWSLHTFAPCISKWASDNWPVTQVVQQYEKCDCKGLTPQTASCFRPVNYSEDPITFNRIKHQSRISQAHTWVIFTSEGPISDSPITFIRAKHQSCISHNHRHKPKSLLLVNYCEGPITFIRAKHQSCIGRFSEAGLPEWMRFVIFCKRSRERLQRTSGLISE